MQLISSGTATLADGVEQVIATITEPGVYVVVWDAYNAVDGTAKLDLYNKITSAGSSVVMYTRTINLTSFPFANNLSDALVVNFEMIVKMLSAGNTVPIDIPWKIFKVGAIFGVTSGIATIGGAASAVIETIDTPGWYVWQLQVYDADFVTFYDDMSLPTPGTSGIYEEIDAAGYTGNLFRQLGPLCVEGTDDLHVSNSTGVEHTFEWSVTRVA